MISYILGRITVAIPLIFAVAVGTYALVRLAPGDPLRSERELNPEIRLALRRYYGLDQPVSRQVWRYLRRLAEGDLGPSYKYKDRSVNQVIAAALPVSASLGTLAYAFALLTGLLLGMLSVVSRSKWGSRIAVYLSALGISVPNFVLGPLLILFFSFTLYWLPPAGWGEPRHFVLPVLTLSGVYVAYVARLVRSGLTEAIHTDFIRTARAAGIGERRLLLKWALRNAILPVITFSGPALAFLITGTVVVERIFAIPGLGNFFVEAATNRDYTLLAGIALFVATAVIVMNLLVDVLAAWVDPRIRYGRS